MGEGTSEIRHLRERVILHDDMLRAMGERIRLLDEMVHELQASSTGGSPDAGKETAGQTATPPVRASAATAATPAAPATPAAAPAARTSSAVRRR